MDCTIVNLFRPLEKFDDPFSDILGIQQLVFPLAYDLKSIESHFPFILTTKFKQTKKPKLMKTW